MSRDLETKSFKDSNPLMHWTDFSNPLRVTLNLILIQLSRFLPPRVKNTVLRTLGVNIGDETAIGLGAMFDIFFPEKISIGSNTTIGYNTTILTHETTQNEFRTGSVKIGDDVLIGANTTVLAGVEIGNGATIGAGSVVTRDVEEDAFITGVPARENHKSGEDEG